VYVRPLLKASGTVAARRRGRAVRRVIIEPPERIDIECAVGSATSARGSPFAVEIVRQVSIGRESRLDDVCCVIVLATVKSKICVGGLKSGVSVSPR